MSTVKIISFSLWGDSERYNYVMLENALAAREIYPNWDLYVYHDGTCLPKIMDLLSKQPNVKLINVVSRPFYKPGQFATNTFWRFLPAFQNERAAAVIVRDADSILSTREKAAVDEFLASPDYEFHIMRDSRYHRSKIMAGMWGCKNKILHPHKSKLRNFLRNPVLISKIHCLDEHWLNTVIYPLVVDKALVHASHPTVQYEQHARDFPNIRSRSIRSFTVGWFNSSKNQHKFVGAIEYFAPRARRLIGESPEKRLEQNQTVPNADGSGAR